MVSAGNLEQDIATNACATRVGDTDRDEEYIPGPRRMQKYPGRELTPAWQTDTVYRCGRVLVDEC